VPELPEVETVARHLRRHLVGARVAETNFSRSDLRYPMPIAAMPALVGARCVAVRRRAKYLLIDFDAGHTLLVHLGMSGRLFVETDAGEAEWRKHEHWRMTLVTDSEPLRVRFVDARRFGALDLIATPAESKHWLLHKLGPDPLDHDFTDEYLFAATRARRQSRKDWLMDSRNVVGVGNIYASETCWRAQVDPRKAAGLLDKRACGRLVTAVRDVLGEAIAAGGTTLRDFVGGDEAPGYFQQQLDAYGRDGEPCHRCAEKANIVKVVQGARATYFCPRCQR
jgi:formamidopyrimidine-DNA glycosylase